MMHNSLLLRIITLWRWELEV